MTAASEAVRALAAYLRQELMIDSSGRIHSLGRFPVSLPPLPLCSLLIHPAAAPTPPPPGLSLPDEEVPT